MRKEYDTIILGLSCFGMGLAAQNPKGTLILEAGEGFGGEFTDALRECGPITRPDGGGASFYDELTARGIMDDASAARGELHLPAVNVVLNRMALERQMNILFRTRVLSRGKSDGRVRVEAVCNARICVFTADRVLDTRWTDPGRILMLDPGARVSRAATLFAPEIPDRTIDSMRVRRGFLPGEAYLTMDVSDLTQDDADTMLDAFMHRPDAWRDMRLIQVAPCRAVRCARIREMTDCDLFIPGCGFDDPVSAWAAGLAEKEALA